jgi:hypothetical protein
LGEARETNPRVVDFLSQPNGERIEVRGFDISNWTTPHPGPLLVGEEREN